MKRIESLIVKYHQETVGTLALSVDEKVCTFEYDKQWLATGFSISPLELPLKPGLFVAKPTPFHGNFGIFEDSLPDGYGRYLLHKALQKEGINDFELSALDRLSLIGNEGMGALTYEPMTSIQTKEESMDFDLLQTKALEVLREQQDTDAGLLLYKSGNSVGCRPKAVFSDSEGHWYLAPAYDLTRCTEGYNGEHATSVNGTGHPTLDDMITVGVKNKMAESKCREIYEEVIGALGIVPSKAGKM